MNVAISINEEVKQMNQSKENSNGTLSSSSHYPLGGSSTVPLLASFLGMIIGALCMLCFIGKLFSKWYKIDDQDYICRPPATLITQESNQNSSDSAAMTSGFNILEYASLI